MTGRAAPDATPRPSPVPLLAILVGGAAWGVLVAVVVAGGSELVVFIGLLSVPLVYALGMTAWRAILGAWLAGKAGRAVLRGHGDERRVREALEGEVDTTRVAGLASLPGAWVFPAAGLAVGLPAWLLVALLAPTGGLAAGLLVAVGSMTAGALLGRLVRRGRMPLGDE